MASEVTLSTAVRDSLLSLKDTTRLIDTTQGRLSTGLRVAAATDDPVSFFQAKTLSDRAFDFGEKKDAIDQGISTVETALGGIEAVESIVRQIKGVAGSLKSATGTQFTDLITQFNSLRTQIGTLTEDTSFQGVNLVNATTEQLAVSFSQETASSLAIDGVNISETGLDIGQAVAASNTSFNFSGVTSLALNTGAAGTVITVTYQGTGVGITAGGVTAAGPTITFGTLSILLGVGGSGGGSETLSQGDVLSVTLIGNANTASIDTLASNVFFGSLTVSSTELTVDSIAGNNDNFIAEGNTTQVDTAITQLDDALTTLRSNAQTLGSNVALLQTRLDFTEQYVNNLAGGAAKLTLADINEEGANLLALQTRQQLGISALAFAGQAEQGILSLFR
ncbi:MAG: flagellin [Rhodospirillaceae bacterium]|jgi:flagellin-like hook-associated protein FlgL|nr:flagellin [Rhodospirillales bacterium]MBT3906626.1 flagellin [Rhodospirillaceae bacterium]MBT4699712.1 flagellin [Rhodospirillaceae bacterium]MBT5033225.1 flagellin [Rhodospirillaceae bacterium]MBT6219003.1 flagellin [Rhodospirillaceae bacterium]